jgi:hypothetical protein
MKMITSIQRANKVFECFEPLIITLVEGMPNHQLLFDFCKNLIVEIASNDDLNTETDMHFSYLFNASKAKDSDMHNLLMLFTY